MDTKEEWKPPVSFPIKPPGLSKVWKVVDVKKRNAEGTMRFSVQEIPEDRYEEVIEHMCTYFICDEPICKCLDGKNDPNYVETFRHFWRESLKQGLSVAAYTPDPNGGRPILAAVNVLVLTFPEEKLDTEKFESERAKIVTDVVLGMSKRAKVFEKYGVDKYMTAFGLSVHPSYRGASLGGHLLSARTDIGREYGISVTSTAFTSPISQKLAERCGFETLVEEDYADMIDQKGEPLFPGIEAKSLKIMAKKLY